MTTELGVSEHTGLLVSLEDHLTLNGNISEETPWEHQFHLCGISLLLRMSQSTVHSDTHWGFGGPWKFSKRPVVSPGKIILGQKIFV